MPGQPERPAAEATPVQPIRVEIPGKVADHLAGIDGLDAMQREVLRRGRTVRRGQGYSLHVTALPEVHQALLAAAAALGADSATSADRKAYRIYADRLATTTAA